MQNGGITPHILNPGTNGNQLGQLSASRPCRLTPGKDPTPVRIQRESQRAPHTVLKKKIPCPCQESRPGQRKITRRVFIGPGTGWTVQGSNPGGSDISAPVQTGPGADPAPYTRGTGFLPRG